MATAGFPGVFQASLTTGFRNIGAVQKGSSSAGFPGTFQAGLTVSYWNIGAVQKDGSGGAALTLSLSDTISVSDTPSNQASKVLSDAISLAEVIALLTGKSLSDSLTIIDSMVKLSGKSLSDTIAITDEAVKSVSKALSDSLVVSDSISASILLAKALSDTLSVTDSISLTLQIVTPVGPSVPSLDICGDISSRTGEARGQIASTESVPGLDICGSEAQRSGAAYGQIASTSRSGASPFGCMDVTRRSTPAELGCSTVTRRTNEAESDSGSGGSGGSTSWELTLVDLISVSDVMARLAWYGEPPWPEVDGCALTAYEESAYGWGLSVGQDPNSLLTGQQIACHMALHAIEMAIATAPGGSREGYTIGETFWGFTTSDPTPKSMAVKAAFDPPNCDPTNPDGDSDVAFSGYATLITAVCAP